MNSATDYWLGMISPLTFLGAYYLTGERHIIFLFATTWALMWMLADRIIKAREKENAEEQR